MTRLLLVKFKRVNAFWGIISIAFGIILLVVVLRDNANNNQSKYWPSVPGIITQSDLSIEYGKHTSYSAEIAYTYTVNGQNLTGNTVYFGCCASEVESEEVDILDRYPFGSQVKVFYQPAHPALSILDPEMSNPVDFFTGLFASSVFIAMGVLVLWIGRVKSPSLGTKPELQDRDKHP